MDFHAVSHLLELQSVFSKIANISVLQEALPHEAPQSALRWVFTQCRELWPEHQLVAQTASSYLALFLATVRLRSSQILELLCWVSICLACKFVGTDFDLQSLETTMEAQFQLQTIVSTEMFIVDNLNWSLNIPTVVEIQEQLRPLFNLCGNTVEAVDEFVENCYCDQERLAEGPLAIALASLCFSQKQASLPGCRVFSDYSAEIAQIDAAVARLLSEDK